MARVCHRTDDLYADELVQAVIADTLLGAVAWDPASCTLQEHVLDAMRGRYRRDRNRARKFPHVSLDTCDDESLVAVPDDTDVEATDEAGRLGDICLDRLRSAAVGRLDGDAVALLKCVDDGCLTDAQIGEATGWSLRRVQNAKRRLRAYARDLPLPVGASERGARARRYQRHAAGAARSTRPGRERRAKAAGDL